MLGGLGGLALAPAQSRGVRVVAACSGCGDRPLGREVGPHLGLPGVQSQELRGSRGLCHLNLEMLCKRGAGAAPWGVGENMTCGGSPRPEEAALRVNPRAQAGLGAPGPLLAGGLSELVPALPPWPSLRGIRNNRPQPEPATGSPTPMPPEMPLPKTAAGAGARG